MKILSIIGSRPQYPKVKTVDDLLKHNCTHLIIDTNQHFDTNMSDVFIEELDINIFAGLSVNNVNGDIPFVADALTKISNLIDDTNPDKILVYGDTNTSLAAALVANKKNVVCGHVEAGIRCGLRSRPEEINRMLVDHLVDLHFLSRRRDAVHVSCPLYVGDMEYVLLRKLEEEGRLQQRGPSDFLLMTVHRQENLHPHRLQTIFSFCSTVSYPVKLVLHHRTRSVISKFALKIPSNMQVVEPLSYINFLGELSAARGVISDSGGVVKICPFFGKKCIVLTKNMEWSEVIDHGYATVSLQGEWFNEPIERSRDFYFCQNCGEVIEKAML